MRRLVVGLLAIAVVVVAYFMSLGGLEPGSLLILTIILAAAGMLPFIVGVVAQVISKRPLIPAWVPWLLGASFGILRFVAPGLGGLTFMDSRWMSAVLTVLLGAGATELGVQLAWRVFGGKPTAATGVDHDMRREA